MADIRYVIVSDLHFGAENSMLTSLAERPTASTATGFATDPQRPSPVLSGLVSGLRQTKRPPAVTLTAAGQTGLREYLEGPVRNQLRQEWGDVPEEITFVYGHTHKPFTDRWTVAGYPSSVRIANTGGWVVDTATPASIRRRSRGPRCRVRRPR